jgi:hypothetical protein
MSVDDKHDEYKKTLPDWEMVSDIYEGERAIKLAGEKYLPALSNQEPEDYKKYIQRGSFFNAFARTVLGLSGFVFRKPTEINVPKKIDDMLDSIMSTGQSFHDLNRETAISTIKYGRCGLLVDAIEKNPPYIALYEPESITNWQTEFIDGEERTTLLVLKESVAKEGEDQFDIEYVEQYRSFELIEGAVEVNVWQQDAKKDKWVVIKTIHPKILGKSLDRILFYPVGSEANTLKVNKPPLIDMAYVNISQWRLSVDYHHGLHFCSLPTPWAAGFNEQEGNELGIGPGKVWIASEPNATCGFLEFTGAGIEAIRKAISEIKEEMAVLGSRMIEKTRSRIETAEAARIRQSGEEGALVFIVNNISSALTEALKGIAYWLGIDDEEISVKLPTDFIDTKLTPQELTALFTTYQGGGMSLDTFLHNLDQGEILPNDRTPEDEKLQMEAEGNRPFADDDTDDDTDDNDDDTDDSDNTDDTEE